MRIAYQPDAIAELYARYRDYDLVVDTRRIVLPTTTVFFALPGRRAHGVQYLRAAYDRGVRHFVVPSSYVNRARPQVQSKVEEQLSDWAQRKDITLILVADPVEVLQALAGYHRSQLETTIIAISGSQGKTTVKDYLTSLLEDDIDGIFLTTPYASPRSYNSQIGVALSLWNILQAAPLAIIEAGVSEAGEMDRLQRMIQPDGGIWTGLGTAHDEGFVDRDQKRREKLSLFREAKWVILEETDSDATAVLQQWSPTLFPLLSGSTPTEINLRGSLIEVDLAHLPGVFRRSAALAAAATYHINSYRDLEVKTSRLPVLTTRMEQMQGRHGAPVISDTYNDSVESLAAALDYGAGQSATGQLYLILQAVQLPAAQLPRLHRTRDLALKLLTDDRLIEVIVIGTAYNFPEQFRHFATEQDLLAALPELSFSPHPIVVKGNQRQPLRTVATALSKKRHRTNLYIDLEAIQHNFALYRSLTSARTIAMVKAGAYGGGSLPIARALTTAGADYLAVAYADEGYELRRGGIQLPIMVLNPEPEEFADLAKANLEPVVSRAEQLKLAQAYQLGVHLELDTGMHRLGVPATTLSEEKPALVRLLQSQRTLPKVLSVFSHLVASEDPAEDGFTAEQYERFEWHADELDHHLGYRPFRHLLNSNGISRHPEMALDAVRIGVGLYGTGDVTLAGQLHPALRLTTRVASIRHVEPGASVGYGRGGEVTRPTRLATINIGYADGLPRRAGEGRFPVWINGGLASTVGSVCMDMTMVDVTDLPDVRVGDEVEIFGPNHSIEVLAGAVGTIGYEILTGVGTRVHRIYVRE